MPEDEDIVKSQAVCDWILTQPRSSDSDVKHDSLTRFAESEGWGEEQLSESHVGARGRAATR
jgi:hypothetical protein